MDNFKELLEKEYFFNNEEKAPQETKCYTLWGGSPLGERRYPNHLYVSQPWTIEKAFNEVNRGYKEYDGNDYQVIGFYLGKWGDSPQGDLCSVHVIYEQKEIVSKQHTLHQKAMDTFSDFRDAYDHVSDKCVGQPLITFWKSHACKEYGESVVCKSITSITKPSGLFLCLRELWVNRYIQMNFPHLPIPYLWNAWITPLEGIVQGILVFQDVGNDLVNLAPVYDRLPFLTKMKLFTLITEALHVVHQNDLFHCDVKRENILVNVEKDILPEHFIKLIDERYEGRGPPLCYIVDLPSVIGRKFPFKVMTHHNKPLMFDLEYIPPELLFKGVFQNRRQNWYEHPIDLFSMDTYALGMLLSTLVMKKKPLPVAILNFMVAELFSFLEQTDAKTLYTLYEKSVLKLIIEGGGEGVGHTNFMEWMLDMNKTCLDHGERWVTQLGNMLRVIKNYLLVYENTKRGDLVYLAYIIVKKTSEEHTLRNLGDCFKVHFTQLNENLRLFLDDVETCAPTESHRFSPLDLTQEISDLTFILPLIADMTAITPNERKTTGEIIDALRTIVEGIVLHQDYDFIDETLEGIDDLFDALVYSSSWEITSPSAESHTST